MTKKYNWKIKIKIIKINSFDNIKKLPWMPNIGAKLRREFKKVGQLSNLRTTLSVSSTSHQKYLFYRTLTSGCFQKPKDTNRDTTQRLKNHTFPCYSF